LAGVPLRRFFHLCRKYFTRRQTKTSATHTLVTKSLTCNNQRNEGRNFAEVVADDNLITAGVRNNGVRNRQARSVGLVDRGVDFCLEAFAFLKYDTFSVPYYLHSQSSTDDSISQIMLSPTATTMCKYDYHT
jgi:hypothetical protein